MSIGVMETPWWTRLRRFKDLWQYIRKLFTRSVRGDWDTNDRYYIIDGELCVDFVIRILETLLMRSAASWE